MATSLKIGNRINHMIQIKKYRTKLLLFAMALVQDRKMTKYMVTLCILGGGGGGGGKRGYNIKITQNIYY